MIANAPVYVHNEHGHLVFVPEGEKVPEFCVEQIDHPDVLPSEEEASSDDNSSEKKPAKRSSRSSRSSAKS